MDSFTHIDWKDIWSKHRGAEVELRPEQGPTALWSRVVQLSSELEKTTEFETQGDVWMLRVQGPQSLRLTVTFPNFKVCASVLGAVDSATSLLAWAAQNPTLVHVEEKEELWRTLDENHPWRLHVNRETARPLGIFKASTDLDVRLLRRKTFVHYSRTFQVDVTLQRTRRSAFPLRSLLQNDAVLRGHAEVELLPAFETVSSSDLRALQDTLRTIQTVVYDRKDMVGQPTRIDVLEEFFRLFDRPDLARAVRSLPRPVRDTDIWKALGGAKGGQVEKLFPGPKVAAVEASMCLPAAPGGKPTLLSPGWIVTEKADGERAFAFVRPSTGEVVLLNDRFEVRSTPLRASAALGNTVIDGEYLAERQLFLAFDLLWMSGKDVRSQPMGTARGTQGRLHLLLSRVQPAISLVVSEGRKVHEYFRTKLYVPAKETDQVSDVLQQAQQLWDKRAEQFDYAIDGLIFVRADRPTPALKIGERKTDPYTLKWKPQSHMTIDFLVLHPQLSPQVSPALQAFARGGTWMRVDLYAGKEAELRGEHRSDLIATPFQTEGQSSTLLPGPSMTCTNGDVIVPPCVVEFAWDVTRPEGAQWVPQRVRYDKTEKHRIDQARLDRVLPIRKLISGVGPNYISIVENTWEQIQGGVVGRTDLFRQLIENPAHIEADVTSILRRREALLSRDELPASTGDRRYYNQNLRLEDRRSRPDYAVATFHAKVKYALFQALGADARQRAVGQGQAVPRITLLDLGCGQGGDLNKYQEAGIRRVVGVDVHRAELEEFQRRFVEFQRRNTTLPRNELVQVTLLRGDMRRLLSTGEAASILPVEGLAGHEMTNEVIRARGELIRNYSFFKHGTSMVSSMFAMHYAFDTEISRWSLLQNVYEWLAVDGLFVAITFDGKRVFQLLQEAPEGEVQFQARDGTVFAKIRKAWNEGTSVRPWGTAIGLQYYSFTREGEWRTEYLVDYEALAHDLSDVYDLEPLPDSEAQELGLPAGTGLLSSFAELGYDDLTAGEKAFSSLYRFFIFRKRGMGNSKRLEEIHRTLLRTTKRV